MRLNGCRTIGADGLDDRSGLRRQFDWRETWANWRGLQRYRLAKLPQLKAVEGKMAAKGATYRAMHVVSKGKLELAEKPLINPPAGHVRIRVEACGVCHSDAITVDGLMPIQYPRVPGHEAVGRIDVIGEGVEGWKVGQRVGVGFLGGSCGYCEYCRDGALVNCVNQAFTGVQQDGGYAEVMIAKSSGLMSVPDELSSVDAAPLLCAGLTTFSALRNSPARAGDLVAIFGVGGLGHLGVQYARRMGFEVVAIDRGSEKAELSRKLGAHRYIDGATNDVEGPSGAGWRGRGVGHGLGRQSGRGGPGGLAPRRFGDLARRD
jgi:D-arabinose 1-dehydrogenase-like Zn-dependent alcohol dehydrogenase